MLKLEFQVPERYAKAIKIGRALQFTVAGSQSLFNGRVYATEPAISETSRTLRVRAEVPNKNRELVAGAFADITLNLDTLFDALLLPTEAIIPKLNTQVVYQVVNGKAQERTVRTGLRLPRLIQVEEGLNKGDTILVSGLLQVKPGSPVALQKQISLNPKEEK
jgi:membrane fusion protein (multidrug efflux system)